MSSVDVALVVWVLAIALLVAWAERRHIKVLVLRVLVALRGMRGW